MAVYRFRIQFEDHEDVYRDIDITGKQTFEDFHRAIQEAIGFDNSKEASFFMSDDYWRKGQEIALNVKHDDDDDDDDFRRPQKSKPKKMKDSKIAGFIDDPHQKIIYVFDPAAGWTLMIELLKILPDDPKTMYPKCVKSFGTAPKQYKVVASPPSDEDDEDLDDEEETKGPEKVFTAEEEYDEEEALEGEEDGDDSEEEEGAGDDGDEESQSDDFAPSYGDGEEDY
ncbi:MAG: hypothetical protein Fur0041_07610 [Bacteroidia bacterium]